LLRGVLRFCARAGFSPASSQSSASNSSAGRKDVVFRKVKSNIF
jgi:hypothetical protein